MANLSFQLFRINPIGGEFFYQPLLGKDLGAQIDTPLKNRINLAPNREKYIAQTLTQQAIDTPQRKI